VNALVVPQPSVEDSIPETEEDLRVFSATYSALKTALRTIKGLSCIIDWVVGIKASAEKFNSDIVLCGVTASKDVTNLINANLEIINSCNNIVNLKSTICAATDDDQEAEAKITNSCFVKTVAQVWKLKKQVEKAASLAAKLPQTGPNASACVSESVTTLVEYYTLFPQNIVSCSKLTS
ncbi:hypothetical protein KR067_010684, partial [Drosophila pandora]